MLVALYRAPEENRRRSRPHKTPAELLQRLLCVLLRWFPERSFVFAGISGFGSHEMAAFALGQRARLRLVRRHGPSANLCAPPAVVGKRNGRPRKRRATLPSPGQAVAGATRSRLRIAWCGGGEREVEVVTGTDHRYKGRGLESGAGVRLARVPP